MGASKKDLGPEVVSDENGNLTAVQKDEENSSSDAAASDSTPVSKQNEKDDEQDGETPKKKQAVVIPGPVKQALLRTTTEALERLMSLVRVIKDATCDFHTGNTVFKK